jgi:Xaa-Pro dipeptidase
VVYRADLITSCFRPLTCIPPQPPPTIEASRSMFDASSIHHVSELTSALNELVSSSSPPLIHTLPMTSQFPTHTPAFAGLLTSSSSAYLLPAIHRARLIKDDAEVALIRRANAISSRAHETVMRVLGAAVRSGARQTEKEGRPLLPGEWLIEKEEEAEAIFVASCRREG